MRSKQGKGHVHEQILPALGEVGAEVRPMDIVIDHQGYVEAAVKRAKGQRNHRLLLLEYQEQPEDPFTLFNLG
jgi:hypothetical protein